MFTTIRGALFAAQKLAIVSSVTVAASLLSGGAAHAAEAPVVENVPAVVDSSILPVELSVSVGVVARGARNAQALNEKQAEKEQARAKARAEAREKARAQRQRAQSKREKAQGSLGSRVVAVAAAQSGDPYVYGGVGPSVFDCSGLTAFAYRVGAGKNLPHSSSAQRSMTAHISAAEARPGDLVFFHNGGGVYHVAVYAGEHSIIHASQPGVPVGRAQIWTSAVSYGRVR